MGWIVVATWSGAALLAIAVLGYCGYELHTKRTRLGRDVAALQATTEPLGRLQAQLGALQRRAAAVADRPRGRTPDQG